MIRNLANFFAFQLGWFACVLGGAHGQPWLGAGIGLLIVLVHLGWLAARKNEWILIAAAAVAGFCWDSLLASLGVVDYSSGQLAAWAAPVWIVVMWMVFATTLNLSLGWLQGRYLLAAVLGAIAGPLAYEAGAALGAASFPDPLTAVLLLAAGWAVFTPALLVLAARLNQRADSSAAGDPAVGGTVA
jgi:hypothetical protein